MGGQCSGECRCKRHVTGHKCDRCKQGFFALLDANPEGCTECFCYGVTVSEYLHYRLGLSKVFTIYKN